MMSIEGEEMSGDGDRNTNQAGSVFEFSVSSLVENYLMLFQVPESLEK